MNKSLGIENHQLRPVEERDSENLHEFRARRQQFFETLNDYIFRKSSGSRKGCWWLCYQLFFGHNLLAGFSRRTPLIPVKFSFSLAAPPRALTAMLRFMEADRVRFRDLEGRILELERSLSELRAEQAQVQERIDAYKYPVLTIPNEITSEIFIHSIPVYPDAPPLTGFAAPTILTHVCHHWREVALATPALWRAIQLHYRDRYKQLHHVPDAWIRRSGSCLLSIDIHTTDYKVSPDLFTETLAAAATRLEHLKLWIPCHFHPKIDRMPLLRCLTLAFNFGPRVGVGVVTYDAPQLRTVFLLGGVIPNVALPWAQLTCLTLSYVAINPCVSVLRQTTNLVRCELRFSSWGDELAEFPGPDLTLPSLKFLSLKGSSQPMDRYLPSFVVPSLCSLDLEEEFLGIEPIPALVMFIVKSGCRLEEVRIGGKNIEHGDLYQRTFPSISFSYIYLPDPWYESDEDDSDSEAHSDSSEQEAFD
ncbi:hypothetical protein C8R45DRAFT_943645 [Mycena sanguinolenta]|nr:hypothetical protein C8R45DRAFT_943645 [Mycena sanguinolenta]